MLNALKNKTKASAIASEERSNCNIFILGDRYIGKTELASRLYEKSFPFAFNVIELDSSIGDSISNPIPYQSMRDSIILLVFDTNISSSLDNLDKYLEKLKNNPHLKNSKKILVGNKIDFHEEEDRRVKTKFATWWAQENDMSYTGVSSLPKRNIQLLCDNIIEQWNKIVIQKREDVQKACKLTINSIFSKRTAISNSDGVAEKKKLDEKEDECAQLMNTMAAYKTELENVQDKSLESSLQCKLEELNEKIKKLTEEINLIRSKLYPDKQQQYNDLMQNKFACELNISLTQDKKLLINLKKDLSEIEEKLILLENTIADDDLKSQSTTLQTRVGLK